MSNRKLKYNYVKYRNRDNPNWNLTYIEWLASELLLELYKESVDLESCEDGE